MRARGGGGVGCADDRLLRHIGRRLDHLGLRYHDCLLDYRRSDHDRGGAEVRPVVGRALSLAEVEAKARASMADLWPPRGVRLELDRNG